MNQAFDPPSGSEFGYGRLVGLAGGPLLFLLVLVWRPGSITAEANATLAITAWIATWWISEAIPIPATSLLPVVLFPLLGVLPLERTTTAYAHPIVFLLLGGFLLAIAVERWGLHERIALVVISTVGERFDRLLLGFMMATAFLSMWISNSATAMLMVPIAAAVVSQFLEFDAIGSCEGVGRSTLAHRSVTGGDEVGEGAVATAVNEAREFPSEADSSSELAPAEIARTRVGASIMLGVAYAASIGGAATLIGSPPNAVFAGLVGSLLGVEVSFVDWLVLAGPLSTVFLFVCWRVILRVVRPSTDPVEGTGELISARRRELGPVTRGERRVAIVFLLVAAGWLLRPFLLERWLPAISDPAIAMIGGLLLFIVPVDLRERRFLLSWGSTSRLPWGVLVLLGAGFAIAAGFQGSGLDTWIAGGLVALGTLPSPLLIMLIATVVVFLTEVNSNTATATVFMPILAGLGVTLGIDPVGLMAIAAMAASYAFMLPVATPPNAIVFGTGHLTIRRMAVVGFWLNLLAILAITAVMVWWAPIVLPGGG